MMGAGITPRQLDRWQTALTHVSERVSHFVKRPEPRRRLTAYLRAIVAGGAEGVERRNGWQLAEAAGDATPYGMQRLIAQATWDADAVRDDLLAYVREHLGTVEGIGILDETGFLKKGEHSAGVQRQYSGTAGRVENCQIGVFLAYRGRHGTTALVDRALYLPAGWCADPARCQAAGIPDDVGFATKPRLAQRMVERALDAGLPLAWVTGDTIYGQDRRLRLWLEARHQPFVLAVPAHERPLMWDGQTVRHLRVDAIADALPPWDWHVLSAGRGSKGERRYRWARTPLFRLGTPEDVHTLLVREALTTGERAYYVVFAPPRTALQTVIRVAGARWSIESGFEQAKQEVGLDQYEVRSYVGWSRYITLALFAHAFLAVMRAHAAQTPPRRALALAQKKSPSGGSLTTTPYSP